MSPILKLVKKLLTTQRYEDSTIDQTLKKHLKEKMATVVPMSNPWKGTIILYISHFYLDLGWCCLKIFSRRRNEMDQTLKNDIHIISLLIGKNYMTKNNDF